MAICYAEGLRAEYAAAYLNGFNDLLPIDGCATHRSQVGHPTAEDIGPSIPQRS